MEGFILNQRHRAHHGGEGMVADVAWSLLLPRKERKENAGWCSDLLFTPVYSF